jgi:hypothetical protein
MTPLRLELEPTLLLEQLEPTHTHSELELIPSPLNLLEVTLSTLEMVMTSEPEQLELTHLMVMLMMTPLLVLLELTFLTVAPVMTVLSTRLMQISSLLVAT